MDNQDYSTPANTDLEDRFLVALPVFNEVSTVHAVLDQVNKHARHILVVDDGSTDGTSAELKQTNRYPAGPSQSEPGLWRGFENCV
jgi:hypothetical protein